MEPNQMERARANRAYLDSRPNHTNRDEVAAFLSFFSPDMPEKERQELLDGVKEDGRDE